METEEIEDKTTGFYVDWSSLVLPLQMKWKPRVDITTYELALCLPYLLQGNRWMPSQIDTELSHFRHFEIFDPNKK